jgi:hypothetical protein
MKDLKVCDLTIKELKAEIDFIEKYSKLKKGEFEIIEEGIIDASDIRLSNIYKQKIINLYNKKIKEERKKTFKLVTD